MEALLNIKPSSIFSSAVRKTESLQPSSEAASGGNVGTTSNVTIATQEVAWHQEDSIISELRPTSATWPADPQNVQNSGDTAQEITDADLINILQEKIQRGEDEYAPFQLGQLYMEMEKFCEAREIFEMGYEKYQDLQSLYQLAVIYHDGLGVPADSVKAFEIMQSITEEATHREETMHLFYQAAFHVGSAFYLGDGVKRNYELAEKWWQRAAKDGSPKGSVQAQLVLAFHFCNRDHRNLKRAFFWFSEACGNGSLEAQGALGIMYFYGLGVKKNYDAAFECLREASERGNIYAQGHLVYYYYIRKLFTKATELGAKLVVLDNVSQLASATNCSPICIRKGLAVACFIMARCLEKGKGVQPNSQEALLLYHKSCAWDLDVGAVLQQRVNMREI